MTTPLRKKDKLSNVVARLERIPLDTTTLKVADNIPSSLEIIEQFPLQSLALTSSGEDPESSILSSLHLKSTITALDLSDWNQFSRWDLLPHNLSILSVDMTTALKTNEAFIQFCRPGLQRLEITLKIDLVGELPAVLKAQSATLTYLHVSVYPHRKTLDGQALADSIQQLSQLTHLSFDPANPDIELWDCISSAIQCLPLKYLSFYSLGMRISPDPLGAMLVGIAPTLEHLEVDMFTLSVNTLPQFHRLNDLQLKLDEKGLSLLTEALKYTSSLRYLQITATNAGNVTPYLTPEACRALSTSSPLEELLIHEFSLDQSTIDALESTLPGLPNLSNLYLDHLLGMGSMNLDGFWRVIHYLPLKSLALLETLIPPEKLICGLDYLPTTLTKLDLFENGVNTEVMDYLITCPHLAQLVNLRISYSTHPFDFESELRVMEHFLQLKSYSSANGRQKQTEPQRDEIKLRMTRKAKACKTLEEWSFPSELEEMIENVWEI